MTYVQVWSKSDQRRLRKTAQTNKPTDSTKIIVTWRKIPTRRWKIWSRHWRNKLRPSKRRRKNLKVSRKSSTRLTSDSSNNSHIYVRNFVVGLLRVATRPKILQHTVKCHSCSIFRYILYFLSVCSWIYMYVGGRLQRVLMRHLATPYSHYHYHYHYHWWGISSARLANTLALAILLLLNSSPLNV